MNFKVDESTPGWNDAWLPTKEIIRSNLHVLADPNVTRVNAIDFDNDLAGLFLDPDGSADFWDVTDGANSADVTRAYTATNWNTAARLGSGGETTWDNLTIGINDPTDVGILATQPIPEPTSGLLGCLAMLLFLKRRR